MVAVVSHVPQLAATTLMDVAATTGEEHAILLRLAAGGFRDMTRIAAGHPGIWPDICIANRDAIVAALDDYLRALAVVRGLRGRGRRRRAARGARAGPVGPAEPAPARDRRGPAGRAAGAGARPAGRAGRGHDARRPARREHRRPRDRALDGGRRRRHRAWSCPRPGSRRSRPGSSRPATTWRGARCHDALAVPSSSSTAAGPLRGHGCGCPGCKGISHRGAARSPRSPTGASRDRRTWPTAPTSAQHRARRSEQLGVRRAATERRPARVRSIARRRRRRPARARGGASTAATPARRCACSCGLVAGRPFLSVLTGDESLSRRPMRRVVDAAAGDGRARSTVASRRRRWRR